MFHFLVACLIWVFPHESLYLINVGPQFLKETVDLKAPDLMHGGRLWLLLSAQGYASQGALLLASAISQKPRGLWVLILSISSLSILMSLELIKGDGAPLFAGYFHLGLQIICIICVILAMLFGPKKPSSDTIV